MVEGTHTDDFAVLSPNGRARLERMGAELAPEVTQAARRRRTRRRAVRGGGAALALLGALSLTLLVQSAPQGSTGGAQGPVARGEDEPATPEPQPTIDFAIVETDRTASQGLVIREVVDPAPYVMDDEELLRTLAAMGRPTGLVRTEGKVWLTEDVTDAGRREPDG